MWLICWFIGHRTTFSQEQTATRWSPGQNGFVPVGEYVCKRCTARGQTKPRPPYLLGDKRYGLANNNCWKRNRPNIYRMFGLKPL